MPHPAVAGMPPETPDETYANIQHKKMLMEGQYAQLDHEMNQIQHAYEAHKMDDIGLVHLFRAFYDTDPVFEDHYNAWVSAYPKSYAARQARATYYRYLALDARGSETIARTPPQQIETMERYLKLAMTDYKSALPLSPRPILTYGGILEVGNLIGLPALCRQMRDLADKADPQNFNVRIKYMASLQTRWGGSLKAMQQYRQEISNVGLSPDLLSNFDAMIAEEENWCAMCQNIIYYDPGNQQ